MRETRVSNHPFFCYLPLNSAIKVMMELPVVAASPRGKDTDWTGHQSIAHVHLLTTGKVRASQQPHVLVFVLSVGGKHGSFMQSTALGWVLAAVFHIRMIEAVCAHLHRSRHDFSPPLCLLWCLLAAERSCLACVYVSLQRLAPGLSLEPFRNEE